MAARHVRGAAGDEAPGPHRHPAPGRCGGPGGGNGSLAGALSLPHPGEFHIITPGQDGGQHRLGFNRRRTYDVVAVDDCLIHHHHIAEALPGIVAALNLVGSGKLRSLRLTAHPKRRELLWQGLGGEAPPGLQDALAAQLGDYLVHQDSLSVEYDVASIDGREGEPLVFRVDSSTFVQVNHAQAHNLYGRALGYLGDRPGSLVEGYAGFGAMSIMAATRPLVADRPVRVTMIEEGRAACILARLHTRLHGVDGSVSRGGSRTSSVSSSPRRSTASSSTRRGRVARRRSWPRWGGYSRLA